MDKVGRSFRIDEIGHTSVVTGQAKQEFGMDELMIAMRYQNHGSETMVVKSRMGITSYLEPKRGDLRRNMIVVYVEIRMTKEVYRRSREEFLRKNLNPSGIMYHLMKAFDGEVRCADFEIRTYDLRIEIDYKDIINEGGVIYLEELDIMLSIDKYEYRNIQHPFSPENRLKKGFASSLPHIGDGTFLMSIKAVDNGHLKNRHDRFIRIGDEVHHIPIERDDQLKDGVWVTSRRTADVKNEQGDNSYVDMKHYSFDEADVRFGLCDSIEKARAQMTISDKLKLEMLEKTHEYKMRELDRAEAKSETEFKQGREQNESKHRQYKERFRDDERKEQTKNFGDWIRLVGQTISHAVALIAIVAKLKPT